MEIGMCIIQKRITIQKVIKYHNLNHPDPRNTRNFFQGRVKSGFFPIFGLNHPSNRGPTVLF